MLWIGFISLGITDQQWAIVNAAINSFHFLRAVCIILEFCTFTEVQEFSTTNFEASDDDYIGWKELVHLWFKFKDWNCMWDNEQEVKTHDV
jgi:hypothetical protein